MKPGHTQLQIAALCSVATSQAKAKCCSHLRQEVPRHKCLVWQAECHATLVIWRVNAAYLQVGCNTLSANKRNGGALAELLPKATCRCSMIHQTKQGYCTVDGCLSATRVPNWPRSTIGMSTQSWHTVHSSTGRMFAKWLQQVTNRSGHAHASIARPVQAVRQVCGCSFDVNCSQSVHATYPTRRAL